MYDGQRVVIPNADIYTRAVTVRTAFETRRSEYDIDIATSLILEKLDRLTSRPLVPMSIKQRKALAGLTVLDNPRTTTQDLASSASHR